MKGIQKVPQASFRKVASVRNSLPKKDCAANQSEYMQSGFKKAIDSGRRSGGGRIVTTFYEECFAIWCGSPTVECTKHGIESCRQQEVKEQGTSRPAHDSYFKPHKYTGLRNSGFAERK